MNALIIDDEKRGAEVLKLLIEKYCPQVKLIGVFYGAEEAIEGILNLKPDLIFLDIELPTATGFDIIEATKSESYAVIFTTAYEHYAIKAFKTQAVDYLLKPIDVNELQVAIKNAELKVRLQTQDKALGSLKATTNLFSNSIQRITLPTLTGINLVTANEILYLESDSNYTTFYLKDKSKLVVSKTLKVMEEQLKDLPFLRVHHSFVVNLAAIDQYIKGDGGTIILKTKVSIPVSRTFKAGLLKKLGIE